MPRLVSSLLAYNRNFVKFLTGYLNLNLYLEEKPDETPVPP